MAINYYRWDDVGAPTLTGEVDSLINLFNACLVDGYDIKVGAGWTKEFEDIPNHKIAYRHAVDEMYLRIVDDGTMATVGARQAEVIGYMTMSDIDTGTLPFRSSSLVGIPKSSGLDNVEREWHLVESNGLIYFHNRYGTYHSTVVLGKVKYFDSTDPYNYVVATGITANTTDCYQYWTQSNSGSIRSPLSNNQLGSGTLTVRSLAGFQGLNYLGGSSVSGSINPILNSYTIVYNRLYEIEDTKYYVKGSIPGMYCSEESFPFSRGVTFSDSSSNDYLVVEVTTSSTVVGRFFIKLTGSWDF